jgi:hypothetical protein
MGKTLDKTMGDRKHLTGHEVERLFAAIKGSQNEKGDRLSGVADVSPRVAGVGGLRVVVGEGRH